MSTSIQAKIIKKKSQPLKDSPQAKVTAQPQPSGLSREELRQIILEMIG